MSERKHPTLWIAAALVLAITPLALAQGGNMPAHEARQCPGMHAMDGHGPRAAAEHRYDPATVTTLTGTVEEVLLRPGQGGATGLHLLLATEDGELEVLVGPTFYVFPEGLEVDQGDEVTVTGSRFDADGTAMLMAREITEGDLTVRLRNEAGMPLWQGQGPRSTAPDESAEADGPTGGPGQRCGHCAGRMGADPDTGERMCKRHGGHSGRHGARSGR